MKTEDYYYTPEEWSRLVGYGPIPLERKKPIAIETEQENEDDATTGD